MVNPVIQFSNAAWILRVAFLIVGFLLLFSKSGITADAKEATRPFASLKLLAVHAHRYQNFEQNRASCEIFGEFQNIGTHKIRSFTLEVKLLDVQNRVVGSEELVITPLTISRENPKGIAKAIEPKEYGYFNIDTENCPAQWMEGKIKYQVKAVHPE